MEMHDFQLASQRLDYFFRRHHRCLDCHTISFLEGEPQIGRSRTTPKIRETAKESEPLKPVFDL